MKFSLTGLTPTPTRQPSSTNAVEAVQDGRIHVKFT
jgi:hypothetical protein